MPREFLPQTWISGVLLCLLAGGCAAPPRAPVAELEPFRNAPQVAETTPPAADVAQSVVRLAGHQATLEEQSSAPRMPFPTRAGADGAAVPGPRTVAEALSPPGPPVGVRTQPVPLRLDLTEALSIVGGDSPQIAYAAARYREAYARLESARVLWLPSIRAGFSFNHHDGPLQETGGNVLDVSRSSLQSGLGVRAVGAGSPAVPGLAAEFHTTDAIYQPRIAAHSASARNAASRTATNDTLLAASLAYLELLQSVQQLRIAEETRMHAQSLADLTRSFVAAGQGTQADADRAAVELVRRRNDVFRAQEAARVASARLAEILSLDPRMEIVPQESTIVPIEMVSVPDDSALTGLVATGLSNRPELAEANALVCEAVERYRRERHAPLIPSVLLGVSQSGFGGGTGSEIDNFGGRFDFDAAVYWEIRNLGLGERARRDEASAQYAQRRAVQVQMMDRVAREVVEAGTQVQSRRIQIEIAESGIRAASDSYQHNLTRIREGQGLPIEALQSIQALDDARREYLRTVIDYNAAQFQLQRSLGWPIR